VRAGLAGGAPKAGRPERAAADGAVVVHARPAAEPPPTRAYALDGLVLPARKTAALQGHTGYVTALAFAGDGQTLATGGLDGTVQLWDLAGERPERLATLRGRLGDVQAVAFAPTAPFLVVGAVSVRDSHMLRWNYTEKDPARTHAPVPGEPARVDGLAFSPDGGKLAASAGPALVVWATGGRQLSRAQVIRGHGPPVKAIAFSPDARRVALAYEDVTVRVWEFGWLRTPQRAVLAGHTDAVTAVAYGPGGGLLATGGKDGTVRLWDAAAVGPVGARAVLAGHQAGVRLVQFAPRGDLLLSVGDGGQVFLWDVAAGTPVREWQIDKGMAYSLALTPDGRYLATGTSDGAVYLYDLELMLVEELAPTRAGL
jgi:WD40 repeat protein